MDSAPDTHALIASDSDATALAISPLAAARLSASDVDRESDGSIKKRKRVRTGCFTCRDRHLKCDEGQGQCQNCRKAGRLCRRGIRLNFMDTQVAAPPTYLRPPTGAVVKFRDDSRTIASCYVGGFERYPSPEPDSPQGSQGRPISAPVPPHSLGGTAQMPLFRAMEHSSNRHLVFNDPLHLSLVHTFVEKIAPWMNVIDETKHFTRILPFYALEKPMLFAAMAACAGCRGASIATSNEAHESLRCSNVVQLLSDSLGDPRRDSALCATAAVIVEVAETLVLGANSTPPLNPARTWIENCGWNTLTQDLGGACSWLSVLTELLGCLGNHRQAVAWDPDGWGVDMNFAEEQPPATGKEELWTKRMIYICGKVLCFLSPPGQRTSKSAGHGGNSQRVQEWNLYNGWCDKWLISVPRSMLPLGQLQPWQRSPQSVFPRIWLVERTAIVAQMLYHVTRIILIKTDPLHHCLPEMQREQQRHAYNVFGIVSSDLNPGIPIFSIPLLAVAAEYLFEKEARDEAISILDQMQHTAGLRTHHVKEHLLEIWGWNSHHEPPNAVDAAVHSDVDTDHAFSSTLAIPFTDPFAQNPLYFEHAIAFQ
ncbi:hypothetical protein BJX61DRAFT_79503 [Aspergillus egyptiacus]|nr:hypothetical protein BJX61DRAFT_79503 [Aspergillus egyptiacus]